MVVYRITSDNNIIRVTNREVTNVIKVSTRSPQNVKIINNGRGLRGANGIGVPDGGQPGEVLIKTVDGTDWGAFEGADKNYTATFAPTDNLVVTHNLNKYPSVAIINSAGDEVIGNVNYLTVDSLMVSFSAAFGGRITCN